VTDLPPVPPESPRRRVLIAGLAAACVVAVAVVATIALTSHSDSHPAAAAGTQPPSAAPVSSAAPISSPALSSLPVSAPPVLSPPVSSAPVSSPPEAVSSAPVVATSLPAAPLGPVILVPGYGGDASMLDGLATRLERAGRSATVLDLPDGATGDLRAQADVLAAAVTKALAAGAPSVDLVGYSAGGIVIGLFVAAHPSEVRRVVSIGSPLHGTLLAGLAATLLRSQCPVACQEMAPGTPLLASLDAAQPARTGVPWTSMWTDRDEVVEPPDSARFTGATNIVLQDICADDTSTHLSLPADPLVAAITLKSLGVTQFASPSASDCSALRTLGAGS
jgi:triacylglycerol lipase